MYTTLRAWRLVDFCVRHNNIKVVSQQRKLFCDSSGLLALKGSHLKSLYSVQHVGPSLVLSALLCSVFFHQRRRSYPFPVLVHLQYVFVFPNRTPAVLLSTENPSRSTPLMSFSTLKQRSERDKRREVEHSSNVAVGDHVDNKYCNPFKYSEPIWRDICVFYLQYCIHYMFSSYSISTAVSSGSRQTVNVLLTSFTPRSSAGTI